MKTIIAVALYVILAYVSKCEFAKAPALTCQQVTAMQNFKPTQLFQGTWYVTHAKEGGSPRLCQKFKFEHKSGDKVVIKYGFHIGSEPYTAESKNSKKTGEGKYSFDCTLRDSKESKGEFKLDLTIIGTDYNKFAIFYQCYKNGAEVTADNFLVLKKNKDDNTPDSEIAKILMEKQKLSLQNLVTRKSQNCKEVTNL
uniref:Pc124, similar to salivary lipocalin n=1 Tax=Panstrongylus chinai TaxID=156444 RepID=A0A286P0W5_9HEMI|nr:Pc124, similar to salivary lipocalin [Panstrongylus chinai]